MKKQLNEAMIWKHIRIVYIKWREIRQQFCVDITIIYQAAAPATHKSVSANLFVFCDFKWIHSYNFLGYGLSDVLKKSLFSK